MELTLKSRADLHTILPKNFIAAELGCAEGYFSADLCRMGAAKLYMVDLWDHIPNQTGDGNEPRDWHRKNYVDAMQRVKGFQVEVLRGISWVMAERVPNESLDMVYIDCCHEYECVKKDLEAWYPKIKKRGIVAGHDINNPAYGVARAVTRFCNELGVTWTEIPEHGHDASFYFVKA